MATKQNAATPKTTTSPVVQPSVETSNIERMKSQRAELDKQIKAAGDEQKRLRAQAKALTTKSLAQIVVEQEQTPIELWMASTLVAWIGKRVRAGQDFDAAADAVFAEFRQFVAQTLESRDAARATQKNATE